MKAARRRVAYFCRLVFALGRLDFGVRIFGEIVIARYLILNDSPSDASKEAKLMRSPGKENRNRKV